MNLHSLAAVASSVPSMAGHVDYLMEIHRPCVHIEMVGRPKTQATSRFGGSPLVPPGFEWPIHDDGEYRFLGQINFAEIDERPAALPSTGLLTLFYAYDDDGEVFWGDDNYILGFYADRFEDYVLLDPPTEAPEAQQIELTGGIDLPRHIELRDDWPFDADELWDLVNVLDLPREYLLGYPTFASLAYDPSPGPEWISLLTVSSLEQLQWIWHDGDMLMVFIEAGKLAERDFSRLKSDAG